MKNYAFLFAVYLIFISTALFGQQEHFKMPGNKQTKIIINENYNTTTQILPFNDSSEKIFGLSVNGKINLNAENSFFSIVLTDQNKNEYLVYETYELLDGKSSFQLSDICEETCILPGIIPVSLKITCTNASFQFKHISVANNNENILDVKTKWLEKKREQIKVKVAKLNANLKTKGKYWVAGSTSVAELSYADKKALFGQSTFPAGFEFYSGGIISAGTSLKSVSSSPFVDEWDWRNRHGKNWITPITDQGTCGSCWSFAAAGATEAITNLFFNQAIHPDLSEQDLISCSGAGSCDGGYPSIALSYIQTNGIVDEACFPYSVSNGTCSDKGNSPGELFKISGRLDLGTSSYPKEEDVVKKLLIENGPLSGGVLDWSHAMVLVGYKVVKEGDVLYVRDPSKARYWISIEAGDPLIGKTVWIFKNSWGPYFGDSGYVYIEMDPGNFGWTHAIKTPIISEINNYNVVWEDSDGDGFYWWGLGEKPADCPGPELADGDDSNPLLGPLNEFGFCTLLNVAPIADFSADNTFVFEGDEVAFEDKSQNLPESWHWEFEGGEPAVSNLKNPKIKYNSANKYQVKLTVTNSNGQDIKVIDNYIEVTEKVVEKCIPIADASSEWISKITVGEFTNVSGAGGYEDFTSKVAVCESGKDYNIELVPGFASRNKFEYWKIWIDFNGDKDFSDNGELVFSASKARSTVSGTIAIPANLTTTTTMRVAMARSEPADCGTIGLGEVEDYTIEIIEAVPQAPIADFSANKYAVQVGESVTFSDLSINTPESWLWSFPGGSPESSTERNPVIFYSSRGNYNVSLTVYKSGFEPSVKEISNLIQVTEVVPSEYCIPQNLYSSDNFIQSVAIGNALNTSTAGNGYSLSTTKVELNAGASYTTELTPGNSAERSFWRIWLDFNGDGDFDDSGELLLSLNNKKGTVISTVSIPGGISLETRMRIAVKSKSAPEPCEWNYQGEVEDYTVSISGVANQPTEKYSKPIFSERFILVFPNPANNNLNIKLDKIFDQDKLILFSMLGSKVLEKNITNSSETIDISALTNGAYILNVTNGEQVFREKIIKR